MVFLVDGNVQVEKTEIRSLHMNANDKNKKLLQEKNAYVSMNNLF